MMRCESGVLSFLAHFRSDEGRIRQRRKSISKKLARTRHAVGTRHTLVARWIEPRPRRVIRDLEAGAGRRGYSVHLRRVDVDPYRQRRIAESRIASGSAEVVDLLARRDDAIADDVGKELGQPRSAREDENVGLQCHAIPHRDLLQARIVRRDRRQGCRLPVDSPLGPELLDHSFTGATREEIARLRLEENRRRIVEPNLRIAATGFRVGQRRKSRAVIGEDTRRGLAKARIVAEHPQHAGLAQEVAIPIEHSPELEGAQRHLRVDRPRAIRRANDSRFAAGAGASVPRRPGVDEGNAGARSKKRQRRPPAERAGAEDDDSRVVPAHWDQRFKGMMAGDSAGSRYNDSAMPLCRI